MTIYTDGIAVNSHSAEPPQIKQEVPCCENCGAHGVDLYDTEIGVLCLECAEANISFKSMLEACYGTM